MASQKRPSSLYMDLKELRNRFDEVDIDGKGYIDYRGLQEMISGMEGFNSSALQELMDTLDRDRDGKVTFEDFQVVFTLERDVVKAGQQKQQDSMAFGMLSSTSSPSSSAYVTAELSPSSPGSSSMTTTPGHQFNRSSLNQVHDSPDLSMHVHSLKGTVFESSEPQRQSLHSEQGDLVLEDIGTEGTKVPSPSPLPNPNLVCGLEFIEKELHSICKSGIVNRKDVTQLCSRLGIDPNKEKEFLKLWDDLKEAENDNITVEEMFQSIKERETIAMVTSTPANQKLLTSQEWKMLQISMESFGTPIGEIKEDQRSRNDSFAEDEITEDNGESSDDEEEKHKEEWIDGQQFSFREIPQSARPSSAKEGSRLSKGHSEASLRQTATFHNFYSEYKVMQQRLEQITQERDTLKLNLVRAETEKKRLIQEGEESVLNLQKKNEAEQRRLKSEFSIKNKDLEKSFSKDRQTLQESLEAEIATLKEKVNILKSEGEQLKEDLKYYQSDNEKLTDEIDNLHTEITKKDKRIISLQERLGIPSDSVSESDLELHTSKIHELEDELQVYIDHNQDLLKQNTELQDRVDELKAECEVMKQKYMEEKRKRQRKISDQSQTPAKPSNSHSKSRHRSTRTGRHLPSGLGLSNHPYKLTEEPELEEADSSHVEAWMASDEDSTVDQHDASIESGEADDIAAQSSTSLLDEIRSSDGQQELLKRISELENTRSALENRKSALEKTCEHLQSQLQSLEENKIAPRKKLEHELRQRMYQKTNLDKRLKQLSLITKDLATARKAVTDKMMNSEDVLAQYLQGLETDINQLLAEDAKNEMDVVEQLIEEVSTLTSQVQEHEVAIEERNKEIEKLRGYSLEQKSQLEDLEDTNGRLQHMVEQQGIHIEAMNKERSSLVSQYKQMEAKLEGQERELKMAKTESHLAIHDLAKKEEECGAQQEKVMKLESELIRLHSAKDQQTQRIIQLESEVEEKELELERSLNEKANEMQEKLNLSVDSLRLQEAPILPETYAQPKALHDSFLSKSPSPGLFSPNHSLSSSFGQAEIVHQMKSQLEQLQKVLIEKDGEEGSEVELSVVRELLQINTSLEESMLQQYKVYDEIVESKEDKIKELEDILAAAETTQNGEPHEDTDGDRAETVSDELVSMKECIDELKSKVSQREVEVGRVTAELESQRAKINSQLSIMNRQKEEIEKLNHYLGKARSKEARYDEHIEQQKKEIMNQTLLIKGLKKRREQSWSAPDLNADELESVVDGDLNEEAMKQSFVDEAELLTVKESLQTAEVLITDMRKQLLEVYQHIVSPSDSRASDLLEFSELVAHIKEKFDSLSEELLSEREVQESLQKSLQSHASEYESLYSEHDEEVRAVKQQKELVELQLSEIQEKFQELSLSQEKQISALTFELDKFREEKDELQAALDMADSETTDLHKQKDLLIQLVEKISLQTLSLLNSVV